MRAAGLRSVATWAACILAVGCSTTTPRSATTKHDTTTPHSVPSADPCARYFEEAGVRGTFVLYDLRGDKLEVHDRARADTGFLPASTFKIFNALVALETGVVRDEHETIPWDGVDRGSPGWNRDHDVASAVRTSAVWFFQEIARRVGPVRMQQYLDLVGYGNTDMSGGIDLFWLQGDLCITAFEQLDFLQRLYRNALPFSRHAMETVKDVLVVERGPGYVVRAKTGWAARTEPAIAPVGWYVGYVERGDEVVFFVLNIDIVEDWDADARRSITRRIFADRGLLPREPPSS